VPATAIGPEAPRPRSRGRALRERPALAYALLSLLLFAPGLVPGRTLSASDYLYSAAPWQAQRPAGVQDLGSNYELADSVVQFQPFLRYTRERLPDVPLWNPYIGGGRPFAANAQSALFSPFTWPSLVLPFWWSLGLVAALKLFVTAFGTWLLGRALGMGPAAAFLAGLAMAFGLWMVTWVSWPLAAVWAWLPSLLWLVDRVVRRPGPAAVAALALVVALQFFGGHPESSFHVLAAGSLFALLPLSRVGRPAAARALGRLVVSLVAALALAAIAILPFVELLGQSADLATREDRRPVKVAVKYVLGLALPEYWGRPTSMVTEPFINARAWYVGTLPLLLAGVALLRPSRERVAVAAGAVVSLAVATGVQPFYAIAHHLPGFSQSHNTRLGVLVALGLALLAGWGLDDLVRGPRRPGRALVAGLLAVVLAPVVIVLARGAPALHRVGDALAAAWAFAEPAAPEVLPLAALFVWLPLACAAAALIVARAGGRLAPATFAALALALVVVDLGRFGLGQNPAIPVEHADPPATGAIRHLQGRAPGRFVAVGGQSVVPPLPPDTAMAYGIADARSYDYPVERRYASLWEREVVPRDPLGFTPAGATAAATPRALRALGLLGVSDVLLEPGAAPPAGLRPAYRGADAAVYANPAAVPRAFLVGAQRVVASEAAALDAVTEPGFDPRAEAVVERPVAGLPRSGGAPAPGDVRLHTVEPERMGAEVSTRAPAMLVTADVFLPGWRARVDGREVPLERVDYLLRGVPVPAGRHRVELTYRPLGWTAGWIVTLLAALGLTAAVLVARRRR
jgi:hypothetical protein